MIIYLVLSLLLPWAISRYDFSLNQLIYDDADYNYLRSPLVIACFFVCVLFKGFAYDTGADYLGYYRYIQSGITGHATDFEYGFTIFVNYIRLLKFPTWSFFVIAAIIYYGTVLIIAKKYAYAAKYIVFLWTVFFFSQSLNLYRQYFAMSFILLFVYFFQNRKFLISSVFVLLAFSFHYSALIGVAVYFIGVILSKINIKYWMVAVPIVLTSLIGNVFINTVQSIYESLSPLMASFMGAEMYVFDEIKENMYQTSYAGLLSAMFLLWSYLGFKIKDEYDGLAPIYFSCIIYFILYPLFQHPILARLLMYSLLFVPLLVGIIWNHFKNEQNMIIYHLFILSVIVEIALFVYYVYYSISMFPYQLKFE